MYASNIYKKNIVKKEETKKKKGNKKMGRKQTVLLRKVGRTGVTKETGNIYLGREFEGEKKEHYGNVWLRNEKINQTWKQKIKRK